MAQKPGANRGGVASAQFACARQRSLERYLWSVLEVPLALGLAASLTLIIVWAACRMWPGQCQDLAGGLDWLFRGAVVGIVVAIAYWCVAFALGDRQKPRMLLDCIALAIALVPFGMF